MAKNLYKVIRQEIGPTLAEQGFSCQGTKRATFYRELPSGVVHVIAPDRYQFKPAYDVWVFPSHPLLCESLERFQTNFPDATPIVTKLNKLHAGSGIASFGTNFGCQTEPQQLATIRKGLLPALLKHAIPYLDQFREVNDIIPFIDDTAKHFWQRSQEPS